MIRLRRALPCFVLAIACGCSTLRIRHDYDTEMDYSQLKTYSWLEPPPAPVDDPRVNIALFEARLERSVNEALAEKGFRKVSTEEEELPPGEEKQDTEKPDFLVGYYITLDRKVDVSVVNNYHGYGWMRGPHVYVDEYNEGTLILDIVDASSRAIIWRGMAIDRVDFLASPEDKEETIREAVEKMLEFFPPP